MKFAIMTGSGVWITDAETISDACDQFDWKYPGTVIAAMRLEDDNVETCPYCGADMRDKPD